MSDWKIDKAFTCWALNCDIKFQFYEDIFKVKISRLSNEQALLLFIEIDSIEP